MTPGSYSAAGSVGGSGGAPGPRGVLPLAASSASLRQQAAAGSVGGAPTAAEPELDKEEEEPALVSPPPCSKRGGGKKGLAGRRPVPLGPPWPTTIWLLGVEPGTLFCQLIISSRVHPSLSSSASCKNKQSGLLQGMYRKKVLQYLVVPKEARIARPSGSTKLSNA